MLAAFGPGMGRRGRIRGPNPASGRGHLALSCGLEIPSNRPGGELMDGSGRRRRAIGRAAIAIVALASALATAGATSAAPCDSPAFRQFDFWLGDWDAYDVADSTKAVGRGQVTKMLGGCALRESYRQDDGLEGESYSLWDASRGRWHQSWVTNRGGLLLLDGHLERGRMVLTAQEKKPDGALSLLRGTWWTEGREVREKAERSIDGGKTWTPVFDMVFRPHRGD